MSPTSLRIAVVGAGLIGMRRARILHEMEGVTLAGVAEVDPDRLEAATRALDVPGTRRWEELARAPEVDAVVVATTNDWLLPVARVALQAGKHVLCEKPPGRSVEEARALTEAAARAGTTLAFGFNHRQTSHVIRARAIVRSGGIGRVLHLRARYGHGARPGFEREWRADPERAGGGELLDQGVHLVDLARLLLGHVERAYGVLRTSFWAIAPLEDNAFCVLEHAAGPVSMLHVSLTQWKNLFSLELFGDSGALLLEGLGGSYGRERLVWHRRRAESGPPEEERTEFDDDLGSWRRECHAFARAASGERLPDGEELAGPRDAVAVMGVLDALYQSARTGRPCECSAPEAALPGAR